MSLRGRPKGRNERQERVWTENEEKIVHALMDKSPGAARLGYLEEKTGLSRKVLLKHLRKFENNGVVTNENGIYRLTPIYSFEYRGTVESVIKIPFIKNGILVIRFESSNPTNIDIYGSNIPPHKEENATNFASTIPVYNSEVTIKFSKPELGVCKVMVFPPIKP